MPRPRTPRLCGANRVTAWISGSSSTTNTRQGRCVAEAQYGITVVCQPVVVAVHVNAHFEKKSNSIVPFRAVACYRSYTVFTRISDTRGNAWNAKMKQAPRRPDCGPHGAPNCCVTML